MLPGERTFSERSATSCKAISASLQSLHRLFEAFVTALPNVRLNDRIMGKGVRNHFRPQMISKSAIIGKWSDARFATRVRGRK